MRAWIQDRLRAVISWNIRCLGHLLGVWHNVQVRRFSEQQSRLRQRYGITKTTPIILHGDVLQAKLESSSGPEVQFAATSGSSGTPKRIPYTVQRLRRVKWTYMSAFCRSFAAMKIKRTSLYVFSAIDSDDSLTAMMMAERNSTPPYLSTLQAPYRVHGHPMMRALAERYGATAVRLWVLVQSNPGALYATNPSTLALFMDQLGQEWDQTTKLVREWSKYPEQFDRRIHRIARRIESVGAKARMERIAQRLRPLSFHECVPGVAFLCCWDGGYVRTYLTRVRSHLSKDKVLHLPMYSMSTETVETLPHFDEGHIHFLPIAPGVLYEFLPVDSKPSATALLDPGELQEEHSYSMVVSDSWGLTRYHTEDVFRVAGMVNGIPDLRFERRLGLSFSFTGEKLSGDHARFALDVLSHERRDLVGVPWMTLVPSVKPKPHYKVLLTTDEPVLGRSRVGAIVDEALMSINSEYADKRKSGRLGEPHAVCMPFPLALQTVGGQPPGRNWEAQFKFLPLVPRTWETLGAAGEE
jgi:hypothetical protein